MRVSLRPNRRATTFSLRSASRWFSVLAPRIQFEPGNSNSTQITAKHKSMKKSMFPNTMKLLFFHNDPKLLHRLMQRPFAAQNLVIPCTERSELLALSAATEPHLVVIAADDTESSQKEIEASLRAVGFHTRILVMPRDRQDDRHLDAIWLSLRCFLREPLGAEFDTEHYSVLSEKDFETTGARPCTRPEESSVQEDRFLALLATGAQHHARAQAYLSAAIVTQRNYQREWTLAALSGDAAAYLWRCQLFRYVSTLAHYIPGVDSECLPLSHPSARSLDYLPTAISPEALYALEALRAFGVNSGFSNELWSVGQLEVTQGPRLPGEAARLAGWTAALREIAIVHIRTLDACFVKHSTQWAAFQNNRHSRNAQRIFCQWWRLTDFMESPDKILGLAKEFHSGRRAVGIRRFCSFYQFAEEIQRRNEADSLHRN